MLHLKEYTDIVNLLDDVDINIDKILLKLTTICDTNPKYSFCKCVEIIELSKYSIDERYHKIIEMPDYIKLNLLSKYIKYLNYAKLHN